MMLRVLVGRNAPQQFDALLEGLASHPAVEILGIAQTGHEVASNLKGGEVDTFLFPSDWCQLARMIVTSIGTDAVADTSCVVAATTPSPAQLVKALLYGFDGLVSTADAPHDVVNYLDAVKAGESGLLDHPLVDDLGLNPGLLQRNLLPVDDLTNEVVELVGSGLTDTDIATALRMTSQDVRNRIETAMTLNGLTHRTQLAILQVLNWRVPDFR
jgi:DNA-binding NarL/FixJ family response regulator